VDDRAGYPAFLLASDYAYAQNHFLQ
jgi:hypothetical protein